MQASFAANPKKMISNFLLLATNSSQAGKGPKRGLLFSSQQIEHLLKPLPAIELAPLYPFDVNELITVLEHFQRMLEQIHATKSALLINVAFFQPKRQGQGQQSN